MKNFPVWISDVKTLEDALSMIQSAGELTGKTEEAKVILKNISTRFTNLRLQSSNLKPQRSVYLIWNNPMMTVGSDTFISHIMERCGFKNVFSNRKRYPEITELELKDASPQTILLSSEPFPFRQKHVEYFQNICANAKILLVDGQMFSWYGSRLQYAPKYFEELIRSSVL